MLANKTDFYKDHLQIEGLWYLYLQCEWAYQMLNEGKGFVSTLPSSWNKDIKQILNNHNKRQLRPDAKETVRYETINNVRYRITDSISLNDKKEASRRANLRTLHRFVEDEFSEISFHRLNNSVLSYEYFKNNQYNGTKLLEADIEQLLFNIQKEIQLSNSGAE